jgi:hypothetical protein
LLSNPANDYVFLGKDIILRRWTSSRRKKNGQINIGCPW